VSVQAKEDLIQLSVQDWNWLRELGTRPSRTPSWGFSKQRYQKSQAKRGNAGYFLWMAVMTGRVSTAAANWPNGCAGCASTSGQGDVEGRPVQRHRNQQSLAGI